LYFGDKWVEFHSFLSNRFRVHPNPAKESQTKLVSEYYPAWMEYLLELVRARGYVMLYPSFVSDEASAIATVHTDLYQPPEEFLEPKAGTSDPSELDTADSVDAETLLTADRDISSLRSAESTTLTPLSILPLFFKKFTPSLDSSGAFALPNLSDLQILSFAGEPLSRREWSTQADVYAEELSFNIGGCGMDSERVVASSWTVDDLFCPDGHLGAVKTASAG
jgi:hypothetical protein